MPLKKKKTARKKAVKKKPALKRRKIPLKKKAVSKKGRAAAAPAKKAKEGVIGAVTHYFPKVRAAVIKLKAPLAIGDMIKVKGHTTDFTQKVVSMQIDRVPINSAKKGDEIGLLVDSRVRQRDIVYKA